MIKAEVECVGPERAKELLGGMLKNRKLRPVRVAQFAADMRADRWKLTGEAIKLTSDGVVIDGEHRLRAIIESGATVETLVIHGVDVADRIVMDTGTTRTLADHLRFLGEDRAAELASAVLTLSEIRQVNYRNVGSGRGEASRQELLALLEAEPGLRDSVTITIRVARLLRISRGLCAALHYEMSAIDADDTEDFWIRLHDGADMRAQHPVLVLRRRLEENAATLGRKFDRLTIHALLVKGWNAYRDGRDVTMIRWKRGGASPEDFPVLR